MPDTLNKQAIINLLIDSPLREPIKINLIDIVNNTSEPDLPKVYSTITKELEIFQKATERRMKLADETIAKLGGVVPTPPPSSEAQTPPLASGAGPLDLPPLPTPPSPAVAPQSEGTAAPTVPPLSVPPLDLPPMPTVANKSENVATPPSPSIPPLQPLGTAPVTSASSDEDALAEIQKELDSLKSTTAAEVTAAATPTPAPAPQA